MQQRRLHSERLEARTLMATLQGAVWQDLNANGKIDYREGRLANRQVYLDTNNNGKLDLNAATVTGTNNTVQNIPDVSTITSTIPISAPAGTVSDVNVKVNIDHTWDEDLDVFLISPRGTRVELFTDVGGSGQNFTNTVLDDQATSSIATGVAPFTGSFKPEGKLSAFNGVSGNGTWTLEVTDDNPSDTGTLINWSITVATQAFGEPNTFTNATGDYTFSGLAAGTYNVRAVGQTGWTATYPAGNVQTATMAALDSAGPLNFGFRQAPATLRGQMFNDYNGDGTKQLGEPVMANQTVFLDEDNDGVFDSTTNQQTFTVNQTQALLNGGTTRSPLTIAADQGRISDVNLSLNISHNQDSDLTAVLISPSGTRVQLFSGVGGNGANFNGTTFDDSAANAISTGSAPFTGTFKPSQLLSALNNESAAGTWWLEITDSSGGGSGTLNGWSLDVTRIDAERSTKTDASGNYVITNLPPGLYNLTEASIANFTPTKPIGPDVNIDVTKATSALEQQPVVTVDPSNPARVFMVSDASSGFRTAYSTNGGSTWTSQVLSNVNISTVCDSDPVATFDEFGNLFMAFRSLAGEVIVASSLNGGQTFAQIANLGSGRTPAIAAAKGELWIAFTNDIGINYSSAAVTGLGQQGVLPSPILLGNSGSTLYPDVAIGPNGEAAISSITDASSATVRLFVDPDGVGPLAFRPPVDLVTSNVGTNTAVAVNASNQPLYTTNAAARLAWDRSNGPYSGRLYIAYTDSLPASPTNLDTWLISTDNYGFNISAPTPISIVSGSAQFLPNIAVDQTSGSLAAVWYDARNDSGSAASGGSSDDYLNTDVEFMGAVSRDGGLSFQNEFAISQGPTAVMGGFAANKLGQRNGLAYDNGIMHTAWADNSNSTGNNPDGKGSDYDILVASQNIALGKRPYRVTLTPGVTKTALDFGNHRNPQLGSITSPRTYTENATLYVAPGAVLSQSTAPNYDRGTLTVTVDRNPSVADVLSIKNQGTGAGQVSIAANEVSVGGVLVGTFSGGDTPNPLFVRFSKNATAASVQAVIRAVTFNNTLDNPSTLQRRIRIDVTDGHFGTAPSDFVLWNVQAVNDPPQILNYGAAVTFDEDLGPVLVASNVNLTDPDSPDLNGGSLTVKITQNAQPADLLTIRSTGTGPGQISASAGIVKYENVAIGSYTGGTGSTPLVFAFNASSSLVGVQALMRAIEFSSPGQNPSPLTRAVSMAVADGDGGTSATVVKNVQVRPINDPPVLTLSGSIGYAINTPPILIATSATVSDVDNANFNTGKLTVSITTGSESKNVLSIGGAFTVANNQVSVGGVVIGTLNAGGGVGTTDLVVTFNANATVQRVQDLIRAIRFNTQNSTTRGNRVVTFTVTDGSGGTSATQFRTVQVQ
jgi:subtilisin-like proprotein convertase family protein